MTDLMVQQTRKEEDISAKCVLLHGPPFVGKTTHYYSAMKNNYTRVCPYELLRDDVLLNLRLLIHKHIIQPLSQGANVVVDECTQTLDIRKSYTRLLASKLPDAVISFLILRPEHGLQQLMWQKEFHVARAFVLKDWDTIRSLLSFDFHQWYQKCEEISDDEGITLIEKSTQLHLSSSFVPLMPCLLLDWPCLVDEKLKDLLTYWHRFNPSGRFIAIAHSTGGAPGAVGNDTSDINSIIADLDRLTSMVDFPIYLYWSDDSHRGENCSPSDLAFLMQLHGIDLLDQNSIYLYASVKTKAMLEKTGMKHIKIDRALSNANLLRFGAVQCTIPKLLQGMEIVPLVLGDQSEVSTPQLPFLKDGLKSLISFDKRRMVYVSAASIDILNRSQEQYAESVSLISGPSRVEAHRRATVDQPIHTSPLVQMGHAASNSDKNSNTDISPGNTATIAKSRKTLPFWMLSKRSSTTSRNHSPKKSCATIPSTVYIMNERELLRTAQLLLDEAESGDRTKANSTLDSSNSGDEIPSLNDESNSTTCTTTPSQIKPTSASAANQNVTLMQTDESHTVNNHLICDSDLINFSEKGNENNDVNVHSKVVSRIFHQDLNLKTFLDELI